jgi:hypothetical protein
MCHTRSAVLELPSGLLTVVGDEPESLLDFFNKHAMRTGKRRHPVWIYGDDTRTVLRVEIDFRFDLGVPETGPA